MAKGQEKARAASPTREVANAIHQAIELRFGSAVSLVDAVDPYTTIEDGTRFLEIMQWLRDEPTMRFNFLRGVTGVDYPDAGQIASVYHLYSYIHRHAHVVKFLCARAAPEVPTVVPIWPTADWFERESYDLLGIQYLGHPDLRRLLLPDDWVGHPLRKDYSEQQDYHGIGTTRASPLDAFAEMDKLRREAREARGEEVPGPLKSNIVAPGASSSADGDDESTEEEASA